MRQLLVSNCFQGFKTPLGDRTLAIALLVIWSFLGTATCASALASDPPRELEWQELVPEGWEPPIIAPAYDKDAAHRVDEQSRVSELDGIQVRLPGYLKPIVYEGRSVSEFLLVPYLPHHVTQHAHLESNQMVYVHLQESIEIDNPFEPIWVSGTMQLKAVATDEGPAAYSIVKATAAQYQEHPSN